MVERNLGVAVLAAGSSRRFGDADKLAQMFRGRRLGEHVTSAIPRERFQSAWVIAGTGTSPCALFWEEAGFTEISNPNHAEGMGTSVALAATLASEAGCDALLIALADMPVVPRSHFEALIASDADIATSAKDGARLPPVLFGKQHFEALSQLSGDRGARDLLARGQIVDCPREWLIDIDTPQDLQRYGQG